MGKVAEQMQDIEKLDGSTKNAAVDMVLMWIGPRSKREIEKTLDGHPTIIPCAVGAGINDGRGVQGYRERKGFLTLKEMHLWQKAQKPEEKKFHCPHCENFVGNTATSLLKHVENKHKSSMLVQTPDFDAAKARRMSELQQPVVEEGNVVEQILDKAHKAGAITPQHKRELKEQELAEIVEKKVDTQCRAAKANGERCGKEARAGSDYCGIASHQEQDA